MCCEPEWPNLSLVNLEQKYKLESKLDTDQSDSDSDTDSIYCTDFSGTLEQWYEIKTEKCNINSTSVPLVDFPIFIEGLVPENFHYPNPRGVCKGTGTGYRTPTAAKLD